MADPDWPVLLASVRRCEAVYEMDDSSARAAFAALGSQVLGRISDDTHQAVVSLDRDGAAVLSIAGTRFGEGTLAERLGDLWLDADFVPTPIIGGHVAAGALHRATLYTWAMRIHPGPWLVEGHSLGGQTAHLAGAFLPAGALRGIVAWEPPKAADDAFWAFSADTLMRSVTVLHGADPYAAWPWIGGPLQHPPGPLLWLKPDGWSWTTRENWSGGEALHASDHDINQVMRSLARCAGRTNG